MLGFYMVTQQLTPVALRRSRPIGRTSLLTMLYAAAAIAIGLAGAPSAQAASGLAAYPKLQEDLIRAPTDSEIYAWIEQGGLPAGREPVTPAAAVADSVDALLDSERRPVGEQPTRQAIRSRLRSEVWRARWKARLLPAFSALSKVSLVASAGTLGWSIGNGLRRLFGTEPRPPAAAQVTGMVAVEQGCAAAVADRWAPLGRADQTGQRSRRRLLRQHRLLV